MLKPGPYNIFKLCHIEDDLTRFCLKHNLHIIIEITNGIQRAFLCQWVFKNGEFIRKELEVIPLINYNDCKEITILYNRFKNLPIEETKINVEGLSEIYDFDIDDLNVLKD